MKFKFEPSLTEREHMNLLCRAKMFLEAARNDAPTPLRALTLVTSIGLLIGYGSFANCAAPAAALLQDDDHQKDHNARRHEIHSHSDGNIEVVVVRDDDQEAKDDEGLHRHLLELLHDEKSGKVNHQALIEMLKANHKIHLHRLHSEQGGDHEVVVIKADAEEGDDDVELHSHLVERLHGKISGKVNHQELAEKLRQIADRLEAHDENAHPKHEVRRKIEILRKTDEPQQLIIELKAENDEKAHSHDGDHAKMILHLKEDDAGHNVFVEEIQGDREHEPHANKLFGTTSDEGLDQAIRELKIELQQLRQKLNQLRSERKNESQTSSDNKKSGNFLWVERADSDTSANKFFLKKSKDKTEKSNPAAFRFDFKTKDRESTENSQSNEKN